MILCKQRPWNLVSEHRVFLVAEEAWKANNEQDAHAACVHWLKYIRQADLITLNYSCKYTLRIVLHHTTVIPKVPLI